MLFLWLLTLSTSLWTKTWFSAIFVFFSINFWHAFLTLIRDYTTFLYSFLFSCNTQHPIHYLKISNVKNKEQRYSNEKIPLMKWLNTFAIFSTGVYFSLYFLTSSTFFHWLSRSSCFWSSFFFCRFMFITENLSFIYKAQVTYPIKFYHIRYVYN